jgi:[acyl-carrier-protein] S-malonyltransferase
LDAIKLVHIRGKLMQSSVSPGEAKMLVIMGMNHNDIHSLINELSEDGCTVNLSTDTADGMGVLAGETENIEKCKTLLESKELRRVKTQYVNMSVPSHCYLLKDAQEKLSYELEKIEFRDPRVPIISNFTALPTSDIKEIKDNLINQLCETVRWRETLDFLYESKVLSITDSGPGKTLIGMARKFKEMEKLALIDS